MYSFFSVTLSLTYQNLRYFFLNMDLSYVTGEPTEEDLNRMIKMKIMDKCLQRFGYTMPWIECSRLMNQVLGLSRDGILPCHPDNYSEFFLHVVGLYTLLSIFILSGIATKKNLETFSTCN